MITKIVARLKTSTVKNVVPFGDELPLPPYDVVRPEKAGDFRRFRIIAHRKKGELVKLEDHIRAVIVLLDRYEVASRTGAVNRIDFDFDEGIKDVSAVSDDGTISMEASFLMPTKTF